MSLREMKKGKGKRPLIITMKGHPCTGKSTLAQSLAKTLKFSLLAQDEAFHCMEKMVPESLQLISSNIAAAAEHLNDLSFKIICRIASTQLRLGHSLIIDSSLHFGSHFKALLQLSASTKARLVVVECNPKDKYEWRQRLEGRGGEVGGTISSWFKPSTWDQLLQLQQYSCDHGYSDYDDSNDVSRLLVDTTDYVGDWGLAVAVQNVARSRGTHTVHFHDHYDRGAIGDGLKPLKVDGDEREEEEEEEEQKSAETEVEVHYHELELLYDNQKDNDEEVSCRGCLEPIYDLNYYKCNSCDLVIHKSCAELPEKKEILPHNFPPFLLGIPEGYSFPQIHRCGNCESGTESGGDENCESIPEPGEDENCDSTEPGEDENCEISNEAGEDDDGFDKCQECLFETNLRCALLPSFLVHDCHPHPLHIIIDPLCFIAEFQCKACGEYGKHARYSCYECNFEYHLSCALLPHTLELEHHRHCLTLTSSVLHDDDSGEVLCDACEKRRNPKHWTYYCAVCAESGREFTCHLKCKSSTT